MPDYSMIAWQLAEFLSAAYVRPLWATCRQLRKVAQCIFLTMQTVYLLSDTDSPWRKHCCCGKTINIIYFFMCVVARAMACISLPACSLIYLLCNTPSYCHLRPLDAPYFSILSHNGRIFGGKKFTEREICILIFCTISVWNISRSKNN
jgi:hypothetical protein